MAFKFNPFTGNFDEVPVIGGKVDGPASSTDEALVRFDGTTGKLVQNSTVTLTDAGAISGLSLDADSNTVTNIEDADIKAAAAIALSKLAAVTADRALVSDGSGFVSASSVTATELGHLSGVTSAIQTQLNGKLNLSGGTMTGNLILNADASSPLQAVTKQQLDTALDGVQRKSPVEAASTGNLTLSGEQTVDGVALVTGDRVLVKDQTSQDENGIYVVAAGAWSRSSDANTGAELEHAITSVKAGTVNANTGWEQTTDNPNVGVDNIVWVQAYGIGTYSADGEGIELSGGTFSLELDGSTLSKSTSGLRVAALGITNAEVSNSAAIAYSKLNLADSIVNADINSAAAIAYSKLDLADSIVNADIDAAAAIAYSKLNLADSIVNADINSAAAIAYSKLNLTDSIVNADIETNAAIEYSKLNLTGSIVNNDIDAGAAIAYSKLDLTDSIVNADINSAAAIAYSKLALTGSIVNADVSAIADIAYSKLDLADSIVNADINSAAAIAYSKLALTGSIVNADIAAAAGVELDKLEAVTADRALVSDGTGFVSASSVTATELGYLSGVTSSIQTQLGTKLTDPMTTQGDLIFEGAGGPERLAIGTQDQVLRVSSGGEPEWADADQFFTVSSVSTNTSAVSGTTYLVDSSGGAVAITLPAPAANAYVIVKDGAGAADSNAITVNPNAAETIDGAASFVLSSEYGAKTFVSDGTDWFIV